MGNPRSFTTKLNANNDQMKSFLKRRGCTSMKAKKAAFERAATMDLRSPRSPDNQEGGETNG